MDLDGYFTLGSGDSFQRHEVFTDREQYLTLFRDSVLEHSRRRFTPAEYTDFLRPAHNLLVLHGDGGIGKSTLLGRMCQAMRDFTTPALPKHRTAVVVDFADTVNHSFETVLLRVRAALSGLGNRWLGCDTALAVYWERSHPGLPMAEFVRQTRFLQREQRNMFADQALSVMDGLLGGTGLVSGGVKAVGAIGKAVHESVTVRQLRREFQPFGLLLDEPQPERMLAYLPILLGWDLERHRRDHGAEAVVLFDTFEAVQALPPERGSLEDLLARTVYLMPNVLFVVAGRRPLRWHDPVRAIGLQYGGEARWPDLGGGAAHAQYPLDGFGPAECDEYLRTRLTDEHGDPVIPAEIRPRIVSGAGGSPLYLTLSVNLFHSLAGRGEPVTPEQFGEPFPELVVRIMRDLSSGERDLLRAAALLEAFDTDTLGAALPGARGREIEQFCGRSFVHKHDEAWPRYRLHESLRRAVLAADEYTDDGWTRAEWAERLDRLFDRLIAVGLQVWTDGEDPIRSAEHSRNAVTALLSCLHGAIEHHRLPERLELVSYTVSQLGHAQVLAALPQAEGAEPPLRRMIEVARLVGDAASDATGRYASARRMMGAGDHPYDAYVRYELAQLGQIIGALDDCRGYYEALQAAPAPLRDAAPWGLAGIAIAQSRQADALRYAERTTVSALDQTRTTDLLGHVYLQGGDFARAADLFGAAREHAQMAGAPLWMAGALRHLTLALMWLEPEAARQVLPQARELNSAMADSIGLAQCDLAAGLLAAGTGDIVEARRLLNRSRQTALEMGTGEPVDLVDTLICAALGEHDGAVAAARRLADQARDGAPIIPAWAAVAALWVARPEVFDFNSINWYDSADAARIRWMRPLERLRARYAQPSS
jgi:hypothetical protein